MYKNILIAATFLLSVPFVVSADDYGGPYCFEAPGDYPDRVNDIGHVRGTCKEITTTSIVSVDPTLQKDYFLGKHSAMGIGCERYECVAQTKYSEDLSIAKSTTIEERTQGIEENPDHYALFDKKFFVPLFVKLFSVKHLSFSEKTMPDISVGVYKKSELEEMRKYNSEFLSLPLDSDMDILHVEKLSGSSDQYSVNTLNYQEYGKYIHAPKGDLSELQYVDVEKTSNMLTNKDLQISTLDAGHGSVYTVAPIMSPLESVKNYWIFTQKNGKLALVWQKSEYKLDNGRIKVVTNTDKNISAAFLLSDVSPVATTSSTSTPVAAQGEPEKKGFWGRFLDLLRSWFN